MALQPLSGGNFGGRACLFSSDSRWIYVPVGPYVRVFNVTSGDEALCFEGHGGTVTGAVLSPANKQQLITCSLDGTLRLWDARDGTCVKVVKLGDPITRMAVSDADPNSVFVAVSRSGPDTETFAGREFDARRKYEEEPVMRIMEVSLAKGGKVERVLCRIRGFCSGLVARPVASSSEEDLFGAPSTTERGTYVVWTVKRSVWVWNSASDSKTDPLVAKHTKPLTCCTVHPTENYVVVGDAEGMLFFWSLLGWEGDVNDAPRSMRHWHSSGVAAASITPDGTQLVTGGDEAVLVIWQLASEARTFLPRLSGPIRSLITAPPGSSAGSPGVPLYAIGMMDSSLLLVNAATMRPIWHVRGLALAGDIQRSDAVKAVFDPRTKGVVVNGYPGRGEVQVFDPWRDRHIDALTVIPRNVGSTSIMDRKKRRKAPRTETHLEVTHVAMSPDGTSVATVDFTKDGLAESYCLKLWDHKPGTGYVLNTRIDAPHKTVVSALEYHPTQHVVVTASRDRTFKVWERVAKATTVSIAQKQRAIDTATDPKGSATTEKHVWSCRSVGFYRDFPITGCSFSGDGSVLAIACAHILTLWSPMSNALKGTLTEPPPNQPIKHVAFVGDSPFLVAATTHQVYVWNLLTCRVLWSYTCRVKGLAVDRIGGVSTNRFALIVSDASGAIKTVDTLEDEKHAEAKKDKKDQKKKDKKKKKGAEAEAEAEADDGEVKDDKEAGAKAHKKKKGGKQRGNHILLFDASSPVPIHTWCMAPNHATSALVFVAKPGSKLRERSALLALNDSAEIAELRQVRDSEEKGQAVVEASSRKSKSKRLPRAPRSAFQAMFGSVSGGGGGGGSGKGAADAAGAMEGVTKTRSPKGISDLFEGDTHTFPTASVLYAQYAALVIPRERDALALGDGGDDSEESDTDSDADYSDDDAFELDDGDLAAASGPGNSEASLDGPRGASGSATWGLGDPSAASLWADGDKEGDDVAGSRAFMASLMEHVLAGSSSPSTPGKKRRASSINGGSTPSSSAKRTPRKDSSASVTSAATSSSKSAKTPKSAKSAKTPKSAKSSKASKSVKAPKTPAKSSKIPAASRRPSARKGSKA